MPTKGNLRSSRRRKRRNPSLRSRPKHRRANQLVASSKTEEEILELVRTGVERFILNNTTVEEFLAIIRDVTVKEKVHSHQLTRSVFSRIVKDAIRKRNLRRSQ